MANEKKDNANEIIEEFSKKYDDWVQTAQRHADIAFAYWHTLCTHGIHTDDAFVLANNYILNLQDNEFELAWRMKNGQCNDQSNEGVSD